MYVYIYIYESSTGAMHMSSSGRTVGITFGLEQKVREPNVPLVGCCHFRIGSGAREDPGLPHMVGGCFGLLEGAVTGA